jgi:hypothetical protein
VTMSPGALDAGEAADRIERQLAERMPEFAPITRRAMSNYFTYQWN